MASALALAFGFAVIAGLLVAALVEAEWLAIAAALAVAVPAAAYVLTATYRGIQR